MKFKSDSPNFTLAIYLALCAARHHAIAVKFSNANLRHCLGKTEGERLSRPQLCKFAETFQPIFRHHHIHENTNHVLSLVLYFNKEDHPAPKDQTVMASCNQAVVNKELRIELID